MSDPGGTRPSGAHSLLKSVMVGLGAAALFARNRSGVVHEDRNRRIRGRRPSEGAGGQQDRGRTATAPQEIPAKGWKDILWRVWGEIQKDRILAVAAGVTFYTLLALFPAIAAFVSIYGLVADAATISQHLATLSGLLPGGALDVIGEQVKRISSQGSQTLSLTLAGSLLFSLWSANAGMKAMIDALNIAYEEDEKRGFIKLNLVSLAFTLGAMLFMMLALAAIVVIPIVLKFIGLGTVAEVLISLSRWPLLLVAVAFGLALLYRFGPSRARARWRWVSWGSGVAAVLWIAVSVLFSWYAANFGKYNETYGSLGAGATMAIPPRMLVARRRRFITHSPSRAPLSIPNDMDKQYICRIKSVA